MYPSTIPQLRNLEVPPWRDTQGDELIPDAFEMAPGFWQGALRIHQAWTTGSVSYAHCSPRRATKDEALQDACDLAHLMLNRAYGPQHS